MYIYTLFLFFTCLRIAKGRRKSLIRSSKRELRLPGSFSAAICMYVCMYVCMYKYINIALDLRTQAAGQLQRCKAYQSFDI